MTLDGETMDALGCDAAWDAQCWRYAVRRRDANAQREVMRGRRLRPAITSPLTLRQKRAITLWLRRGKPVSEIAHKVGVTRSAVIAWRSAR